jgi:hypothetical protein
LYFDVDSPSICAAGDSVLTFFRGRLSESPPVRLAPVVESMSDMSSAGGEKKKKKNPIAPEAAANKAECARLFVRRENFGGLCGYPVSVESDKI